APRGLHPCCRAPDRTLADPDPRPWGARRKPHPSPPASVFELVEGVITRPPALPAPTGSAGTAANPRTATRPASACPPRRPSPRLPWLLLSRQNAAAGIRSVGRTHRALRGSTRPAFRPRPPARRPPAARPHPAAKTRCKGCLPPV